MFLVSIDPDEEPEKAMLAFMGISGFSTTKVTIELANHLHG